MFSDEEIKEMHENNFKKQSDESNITKTSILSKNSKPEVCLTDKYPAKKDFDLLEPLLSHSGRNDPPLLDGNRSLFQDRELLGLEPQVRFPWTEDDGALATLLADPAFGMFGQKCFVNDDNMMKREADTSGICPQMSYNGLLFAKMACVDPHLVTSSTSALDKPVACKVDKTDLRSRFHYVKYLRRQGRTIKLWECGICHRDFQHQYTLMRHLPTHTDERNFHCEVCGKSFRQLSTLSQHRAIHSSERPYACEVCNKTFNRVSTLISHRKTHSDEKPYKCHLCSKGFHQKGNLRNHLFTHTNERPYRCSICNKGFNQQSNLVCHKNKMHPDDNCNAIVRKSPRSSRPSSESRPDSTKSPRDQCEVSSSASTKSPESYLSSLEGSSSSTWSKSIAEWNMGKEYSGNGDIWSNPPWSSGVLVDTIKTYHMEVALMRKQTPFALLKPELGTPVLVRVVQSTLPEGKQLLVPATADDLKEGGKIIVNSDEEPKTIKHASGEPGPDLGSAVQIKVPIVATVIPRFLPDGRLKLIVEEPHHAYHTALSSEVVNVEPCSSSEAVPPAGARPVEQCRFFMTDSSRSGRISSTCALPPPSPSPPLDLIPLDLFEPIENMPMGPQATAVSKVERPSSSSSDILIGGFKSIPLSDSD